jgi:hypothetical protein
MSWPTHFNAAASSYASAMVSAYGSLNGAQQYRSLGGITHTHGIRQHNHHQPISVSNVGYSSNHDWSSMTIDEKLAYPRKPKK